MNWLNIAWAPKRRASPSDTAQGATGAQRSVAWSHPHRCPARYPGGPPRGRHTSALDDSSRRMARRPAECSVRTYAACMSHSALDGAATGAELLATGHGKAVRTAAGPAQPTSTRLRERRQARGCKQHGPRTFGAERFTAGVGRRGEISARKPVGREPARHACPKGWASCEERAAERSVAADVG